MFEVVCKLINQYPPVAHIWLGPIMFIAVTDPKHIEVKINKYITIYFIKYNPQFPVLEFDHSHPHSAETKN